MNQIPSIIIKNGVILTMNEKMELIEDGMVVIAGDKIIAVGETGELEKLYPTADKIIDARKKCVMPGLVDLHFHSAAGKGFGDSLDLVEYLDRCWYPIVRALTPEDVYWFALCSYSEAIRAGATCVNDQWRQMEACGQAAIDCGVRAVLCNDVADDEHQLDSLEDNHRLYEAMHGKANGRIEVFVGIEWLWLSSFQQLKDAAALAKELDTGIHIHLNESLPDVEGVIKKFGYRPTIVAYDAGLLGPRTVAAHCVWLDDMEIALMRETGTNISHNPSSNAKLGNGFARVPEMLQYGINVGLGHDAAECNNSVDMFAVLKWASLIQKANRVDASLMPARQVLKMATINGNKALGHNGGMLEAGKKADVILVDMHNEHFTPLVLGEKTNIYAHLVFAANGGDVHTSIIDGEVVMENRMLTKVDQFEAIDKADACFRKILDQIR